MSLFATDQNHRLSGRSRSTSISTEGSHSHQLRFKRETLVWRNGLGSMECKDVGDYDQRRRCMCNDRSNLSRRFATRFRSPG
jgi:hypothetical protein